MGVVCATLSRSIWTKKFLGVVIWPIEQWISFEVFDKIKFQNCEPPYWA